MIKPIVLKVLAVLALPFFAALLYACAHTQSLAESHPATGENTSICRDCHTDGRAALTHTADFDRRHKFYAYQHQPLCSLCHAQAFCSDCHAHREELKPSDKYKEAVTRQFPHRGDYLTQHQIDGRLNPAWCASCHGRQNNERCGICHRR